VPSRRKKKGFTTKTAAIVFVVIAVAVVSYLTVTYLRGTNGERALLSRFSSDSAQGKLADPAQFNVKLKAVAVRLGASQEDIKIRPSWRQSAERWTILVPANQSLLKCNLAVTEEVRAVGGRIADAFEGSTRETGRFLRMQIVFGDRKTHVITFQKSGKVAPVLRASMAIVIDDLGYGDESLLEEFLNLDYGITFSVLPGYRGSKRAQDEAIEKGKEVLLHLPMEPHGYPGVDPGKNPILVDLSEGAIRDRVGKHLGALNKVCGINNHMGSLATQDPEVMRAVLKLTKERGLFFLDSKTGPATACKKVAAELGVVCLENDLFLDTGKKDEKSIRRLFEKAEGIALERGRVIVIGHLYPGTLKVLKNRLAGLDARGIKVVPLSHFARSPVDVL
jgi:polysaccharide deacetylase 2 family uncharacterized protein YibQ